MYSDKTNLYQYQRIGCDKLKISPYKAPPTIRFLDVLRIYLYLVDFNLHRSILLAEWWEFFSPQQRKELLEKEMKTLFSFSIYIYVDLNNFNFFVYFWLKVSILCPTSWC